jgi:hypothetical protein
MKVTVYANWREEKVISEKEYKEMVEETAKEYVESRADFCNWLADNYIADAVWFMDAEERERVKEEYREACQTWAEDEVNDYWKPYEVEV